MRELSWSDLRSRACAAASTADKKAALAEHLGVTVPAVYQWLSGKTAPTANTTLRLLFWVEQEEDNNKGPAARQRRRTGRPDSRPPYEKKPKPSPRKR